MRIFITLLALASMAFAQTRNVSGTPSGTGITITTPSGSLIWPSGFVHSWNAGDVTLTHSANALTFAGGNIIVPTLNGLTVTTSSGTLTIANSKVFTVNNTITFTGTDGTTITLPSTSATMARTDATNSFQGTQSFQDAPINESGLYLGGNGTGGVFLSYDGDGALIMTGAGAGQDENLTWNFDDVANSVGVSSLTGVNVIDFGTIGLTTSGALTGVGTALTALNGENVQDDTIDDDSLDFGTGADQISAADIPIADTGSIFTATDAEAALLELAKVPTKETATTYTIGTTDPREAYGGVIYVTGACTVTAPAAVAGMSFTVITIGAVAVSVDVNGADTTYLNGTALSAGDKITNASTTGDIAVFTYKPTGGWYATTGGGTWTDGN